MTVMNEIYMDKSNGLRFTVFACSMENVLVKSKKKEYV